MQYGTEGQPDVSSGISSGRDEPAILNLLRRSIFPGAYAMKKAHWQKVIENKYSILLTALVAMIVIDRRRAPPPGEGRLQAAAPPDDAPAHR